MAGTGAIAVVGRAIVALLEAACPRAEFPLAQFGFHQAADFRSPDDGARIREGISILLYRVTVGQSLRSNAPRLLPDGRRFRPRLELDLHFLFTAWGRTAEMQAHLLGWAMRALADTPIVPASLLNQSGAGAFAASDEIELAWETLGIQDANSVYEMQKPNIQLSVPLVARAVPIDSEIPVEEGRLAQTREFAMAGVP